MIKKIILHGQYGNDEQDGNDADNELFTGKLSKSLYQSYLLHIAWTRCAR